MGFEDHAADAALEAQAPPAMYGLKASQMRALGLCGDDAAKHVAAVGEAAAEVCSAKHHYRTTMGTSTTMLAGGGGGFGAASQAPPDLPSMLLNSRICYIGMSMVPAVTELVVAQLLWLQYDSPEKDIYVYINSEGSQTEDGKAVGFEAEAFAIADTLDYIRPQVNTICVGKAWGQAAMLLGYGTRGKRFSLPHSSIKLCSPVMNASRGIVTDISIKADEITANTDVYVDMLRDATGHDKEKIAKDIERPFYMTPEMAVEYKLIDKVLKGTKDSLMEKKDYDQLLSQAQRAASQGIIAN